MPRFEDLRDVGWLLLPSVLREALCADIHERLGSAVAGRSPENPREGHVIRDVLTACPGALEAVTAPVVLDAVRFYLGDDIRIEALSGIVSDDTRPFMRWHAHVGGIEQDRVRPRLSTMRLDAPRRVMCLVYPTGCMGPSGALLVFPRKLGDPLTAPFPTDDPAWPGAVEVQAPPGSVVIADEAAYHAVLPQTRQGSRCIVGAYFVRAADRVTDLQMPALARLTSDDPVIRRLLAP
jgi:hypothetical protein